MPLLDEQLKRLLPQSLNEVITINREIASLRLATADDIAALQCDITADPLSPKGTISGWAFIALELRNRHEVGVSVFLTGYSETESSNWMTSRVLGFDEKRGIVTTNSGSVYVLRGDSTTRVDIYHVCAMLNSWGLGRHLGIAPFFF